MTISRSTAMLILSAIASWGSACSTSPANTSTPGTVNAPAQSVSPTPGSALSAVNAQSLDQSHHPVPVPTPQISSGGDDLSLFAEVRSALSGDPELLKGVIVNVKAGAVVLSGKVSTSAQRDKAERLTRNLKGIKAFKNEIHVAG